MKRSELINIINESIKKHLSEAFDKTNSLDDIFQDVTIRAEQYERYAQQLQREIKVVGDLCTDIADAISTKFSVKIGTENFQNCSLDDNQLHFEVLIPINNFLSACKRDEKVMELYKDEGGQTEEELLQCGISNDYWTEDMFTSDGASVGDGQHRFWFNPRKVVNNMVICDVLLDGAFVNYD